MTMSPKLLLCFSVFTIASCSMDVEVQSKKNESKPLQYNIGDICKTKAEIHGGSVIIYGHRVKSYKVMPVKGTEVFILPEELLLSCKSY